MAGGGRHRNGGSDPPRGIYLPVLRIPGGVCPVSFRFPIDKTEKKMYNKINMLINPSYAEGATYARITLPRGEF